ncbi:EpsG family protein [Vibrio vulnificus]|uniref:EpsG family protein n=1 Tax=Vibrio vulnificus TaxID=672 RepID=UPI003EDADB9D
MEVYLILLCLIVLYSIPIDVYRLKVSIIFPVIVLTIFSGLRYDVGTDFKTYEYYISLLRQGYDTYMEPGFEAIVYSSQSLGFNGQVTFFLSSLLIALFSMLYIKRHSYYIGLSIVIFLCFPIFYLASFNGVRQFIAVSIFLFSIRYILEKNIVKYLFCVAIACAFHMSAVILLPLYYVLNSKIERYKLIFLVMSIFAMAESLPYFLEMIGFSSKYTSTEIYSNSGFDFKLLVILILYMILRFLKDRYMKCYNDYNIASNMLLITCVIGVIPLLTSLPSAPVIRVTSYFSPALIIVIPNLIRLLKVGVVKVSSYCLILSVCIAYYILTLISSGYKFRLLPYNINLNLF